MGGGLMQLVAYGAQDIYLTGNPEISFFKLVYRRHTNFSMESIRQTFSGTVGFGKKVEATISRNGDLITDCWLRMKTNGSGHIDLKNSCLWINFVELQIGGQRIDKHYGIWMHIWINLTKLNSSGLIERLMTYNDIL